MNSLRLGTNKALKGTPAFMSIEASNPDTDQVRSLKDDLESLLYVVLYCALLWLPVTSPQKLQWWLNTFQVEEGGGASHKQLNSFSRQFTKSLESTRSRAVLDWLNAAMDLHHRVHNGYSLGRNPAWDDGKALGDMWEKVLEGDSPEDDQHENPLPDFVRWEQYSLRATYTTHATLPIRSDSQEVQPPPRVTIKRSVSEPFGSDDGLTRPTEVIPGNAMPIK